MFRAGFLSLFAGLVGCGSAVGAWGVEPASGQYALIVTLASDSCMLEEDLSVGESQNGSAYFAFNENGGVVIDQDESLNCRSTRASVSCKAEFEYPSEQDGYDYTIVQTVSLNFDWDTDTTFSGRQSNEVDCTGSDCWMLLDGADISLPCSTDYDIEGSLSG